MSRKLLGIGAAALTAGMLLAGMSFASSGGGTAVFAGEDECVTFTPTRTHTRTATGTPPTSTPTRTATAVPPTSTPTDVPLTSSGTGDLVAFGNQTPQKTCANTPTTTHTVTATGTTVPATATKAPVTNTPTGGAGGAVKPPSTGFGPDSDSGSSAWLLLAGAALVLSGGGAIVAGARRRS